MAAVSPPLDMLLRLSVCCGGRMSLGLGECQWRPDPSVTVSARPVMNGPGMRREDGMDVGRGRRGEERRGEGTQGVDARAGPCAQCTSADVRAWRTHDELTANRDVLVNRCSRG